MVAGIVLIIAYASLPRNPSAEERLEMLSQQHFNEMTAACQELVDADDRLSGRDLTRPYERDMMWDLKWKPSRPELAGLAAILCGPGLAVTPKSG